MKLFDFLTSTRRPEQGTQPLSRAEVLDRLAGLNRDSAPFRIIDGRAEGVDLIAEWKIADARWHPIFFKAGLEKVFRVYLRLDEGRREVRAMDREYEVTWWAGAPRLSISANAFRGQKTAIEFGRAYAFTETLAPGKVYNYRFDARELKQPIQEAVTNAGWTYKGVAFGKL